MTDTDEPKANTGRCLVCQEDVHTHDLVGHIRVMHPDQYADPILWPDGGPLVVEDLSIEDFTGGAS